MSESTNGTLRYRIERLERDVKDLEHKLDEAAGKIDRLVIVFVTGTITISVLLVGVAITIVTQRP